MSPTKAFDYFRIKRIMSVSNSSVYVEANELIDENFEGETSNNIDNKVIITNISTENLANNYEEANKLNVDNFKGDALNNIDNQVKIPNISTEADNNLWKTHILTSIQDKLDFTWTKMKYYYETVSSDPYRWQLFKSISFFLIGLKLYYDINTHFSMSWAEK